MPSSTHRPMKKADRPGWWGEFETEPGRWSRWLIGPMEFLARAIDNEWRFAWKSEGDLLSERVRHEKSLGDESVNSDHHCRRFTLENPGIKLRIMPRLADRPVIVRPETPLFLPPGQRATLYVSTGVWLVATPAYTDAPELMEIPLFRSTDTWFGHNTMEGELCYASLTNARTEVGLLAQVPHRAFTPIDIANSGQDSLAIEALRVPVTMLSLYSGKRGLLWTDKISFEREAGESAASLRISDHEELSSESATRLSAPRITEQTGIVHTFSRMFGKGEF